MNYTNARLPRVCDTRKSMLSADNTVTVPRRPKGGDISELFDVTFLVRLVFSETTPAVAIEASICLLGTLRYLCTCVSLLTNSVSVAASWAPSTTVSSSACWRRVCLTMSEPPPNHSPAYYDYCSPEHPSGGGGGGGAAARGCTGARRRRAAGCRSGTSPCRNC